MMTSEFFVYNCSPVFRTPENEKLLIEILELLIPGKHIASITFINREQHGLVISEKNVTFDLLNRLYTATELSSMTVTTRQNYDKIMHNELDRLAENAFAREQGFAKGVAEGEARGEARGEAKGEAKEKAIIAKAMLADNVNPAMIAKYTGLSEEEIQKLSQSPEIQTEKS